MQNKRDEGTGDMASKDASFKSYVVAKCGITALNMETMTLSRRLARILPVSQLNQTHDFSPACKVQIGILRCKLLAGGPETPRIRCEGALPVRLTDAKTAAAGGDTSYAATGAASLKASRGRRLRGTLARSSAGAAGHRSRSRTEARPPMYRV